MTRRSNAAADSRGGAAVAAIDEEESGIKLFGRTIEPKMRAVDGGELNDEQILSADDQELSATAHQNQLEEEDAPTSLRDELGSSSGSCEEDKPDGDARVVKMKTAAAGQPVPVTDANKKSSTGGNAGGAATEQQQEKQMPRRPDKPVPCPRCNSMETKFCYFNNYNVNQPRHFCKNCQRYWTAGGTLRNVPVGAGRRKSKHNPGGAWNSGPHHHEHLNNAVRADGSTAASQLNMNGNLKAQQQMKVPPGQAARMRLPPILPQEMCHLPGPETSPSGSSMITSLNSSPASMGSMFNMHLAATAAAAATQAPAEGSANVSPVGKSGSSAKNISDSAEANVGTADSRECLQHGNCRPEANSSECSGCTGGFNMFNGCHWPYSFPWSNVPAGTGGVQGNSENKQMQADMAAWLSGVWAAGMPAWAPFAAASLWGPAGAAGWNMPWGAAAAAAAAAAFAAAAAANGVTAAAAAAPFSKSLGKHARDKPEGGRVDGCLWAPKTLRIDDPGEAAKSSIWATLGLDKVPGPGAAAGGISNMYKAFQGKHSSEARSQVHANPAALSRSMSFHENN